MQTRTKSESTRIADLHEGDLFQHADPDGPLQMHTIVSRRPKEPNGDLPIMVHTIAKWNRELRDWEPLPPQAATSYNGHCYVRQVLSDFWTPISVMHVELARTRISSGPVDHGHLMNDGARAPETYGEAMYVLTCIRKQRDEAVSEVSRLGDRVDELTSLLGRTEDLLVTARAKR